MRRLALWGGALALGLGLSALALVAAIPYLVDLPRARSLIATSASQALGRPVRFASVSVRLWPVPAVELNGLEVAEDPRFGTAPFVTLDRGLLRLRLRPLFTGRVEFGGLTLERPLIRIVEGADGRWNVSSLGVVQDAASALRSAPPAREPRAPGAATRAALLAAGVTVDEAIVTYAPRASGVEYRLTGVDLRLRGSGPTLMFDGKGVLSPGAIEVQVSDGSLVLGGSRALTEAPLRGTMTVEGAELRFLAAALAPPGFSAGGKVRARFVLGGVLGSPQASGQVALPSLEVTRKARRCVPTDRVLTVGDVLVAADVNERQLLGRPVTAKIGSGSVSANLTATFAGGLHLALADIGVRNVPLKAVLVDFLCDGYAVTGPLDLTGALALRASDGLRSLSGEGRFAIGRGEVVGTQAVKLVGDMVKVGQGVAALLGEEVASPLQFESITGTYRIDNGVATTRDLLYTGRGFSVNAVGAYTLTSDGLNVEMVVKHQRGQVKATVTGTAAAPQLHVDVVGALREVESQTVERGIRDLLKRFR